MLAQSQSSRTSENGPIQVVTKPSTQAHHLGAKLMVVGCAAVDISAKNDATSNAGQPWQSHSTSPGKVTVSLGGVGRNMAEAAHRVLASQGHPLSTVLLSCIGDDAFGRLLAEETRSLGMRTDGLIQAQDRTAVCSMLFDAGGNLVGGVADMDVVTSLNQKFVCSADMQTV
jgi:pseudouridine-5'-phosphate glycosidase/pseudouridine kinase